MAPPSRRRAEGPLAGQPLRGILSDQGMHPSDARASASVKGRKMPGNRRASFGSDRTRAPLVLDSFEERTHSDHADLAERCRFACIGDRNEDLADSFSDGVLADRQQATYRTDRTVKAELAADQAPIERVGQLSTKSRQSRTARRTGTQSKKLLLLGLELLHRENPFVEKLL